MNQQPDKRAHSQGSVLVGLIVTMVILAVLGVAMFSFLSTATLSQLGGNSAQRAYYLAESGFRYIDRELAGIGINLRDSVLESLHNKTYLLTGGDEQIELKVYPYYYKASSDPGGTAVLDARVPGGLAPSLNLTSGYLKLQQQIIRYASAVISGENSVVFSIATGTWPAIDNLETASIQSVSYPDGLHTLNRLNNVLELETSTGSANAFPPVNGTFRIDDSGRVWSYTHRIGNSLEGIAPLDEPDWAGSITVDASTAIVLTKCTEVQSTGIINPGTTLETVRKVTYFTSMSDTFKTEFHDTFEDTSHWKESALGSHEIQTIGGDSALRVTGTRSLTGAPKVSLIGFNWASTRINLATASLLAGGYLSYDAEVKVGFVENPTPDWGYEPEAPIPKYFAAGISFRLDNDLNAYGLSFLRGNNALPSPYDNIFNEIVPENDKLLIVLWELTEAGDQRRWLAYKDLSEIDFFDDVENGTGEWTADGLWHITTHRSTSASHSWYYGREDFWTYDTGLAHSGTLVSPDINLCGYTTAFLTFRTWYQTENEPGYDPNTHDVKCVDVSTDGGDTWSPLSQITLPPHDMGTWLAVEVPLNAYLDRSIKIRFRFDTIDRLFNTYEGWYIDDVAIVGTYNFPVNEATLAVRINEAATLSFTSGGTTPIESGDVVGQANGASGTVIGTPVVSSGSWAAGNAAGVILLNNLSEISFQNGTLSVQGKGANLATVTGLRTRDNYIRAYYSDPVGCGVPNDNPFDRERRELLRGTVEWPPDDVGDWSEANDYFTLIQWDAVNTGVVVLDSVDEPDTVLRTDTLTTSSPFNELRPELGLHTLGKGSQNVFFDDFAVQAELYTRRTGFLPAIQQ